MKRTIPLLTLILFAYIVDPATALDVTPPSTISPKAAAELRQLSPAVDPASTGMSFAEAFEQLQAGASDTADWAKELFPGQIETVDIDGAQHLLITPDTLNTAREGQLLIHVHGGAHVYFSPETALQSSMAAAHYLGVPVLSVRYPLAWQAPYPASRDRVVTVYRALLQEYPAKNLAIFGESAGGGLILSVIQTLQQSGTEMPAAAALLSPWVDVSGTGDSYAVMSGQDPVIEYSANLSTAAKAYAGDLPLTDPGPSPIYGTFGPNLPPIFLTTGTRDLFLSDVTRLQRKLKDAQTPVELIIYEGMWHVFQTGDLPESEIAWRDMADFFAAYWP